MGAIKVQYYFTYGYQWKSNGDKTDIVILGKIYKLWKLVHWKEMWFIGLRFVQIFVLISVFLYFLVILVHIVKSLASSSGIQYSTPGCESSTEEVLVDQGCKGWTCSPVVHLQGLIYLHCWFAFTMKQDIAIVN